MKRFLLLATLSVSAFAAEAPHVIYGGIAREFGSMEYTAVPVYDYAATAVLIYPNGSGGYSPAGTASGVGPIYDNGPTIIPLCPVGTGANPKYQACAPPGGGSSGVSSFNGRTGAVTPASGDYTASQVGAAPATNPTGGANNYAPIASPTFTGVATVPSLTFPDTSSNANPVTTSVIKQSGGSATQVLFLGNNTVANQINVQGQGYNGFCGSDYSNGTGCMLYSNGTMYWFINGTETMKTNSAGVTTNISMTATQFIPSGGTPTIANGAAAGTAPGTPTYTGTNSSGVINITTGTAPTANATLATVTFSGTLAATPYGCRLMPRNAISAAASTTIFTGTPSTTTFTISTGGAALTASSAYSWSVACL